MFLKHHQQFKDCIRRRMDSSCLCRGRRFRLSLQRKLWLMNSSSWYCQTSSSNIIRVLVRADRYTFYGHFIFDRATSYSIESAHHLGTSSVPIAIVVCGISRPESPLAGIAFSIKKSRKLFIRNHIKIQLRFRENIKSPSIHSRDRAVRKGIYEPIWRTRTKSEYKLILQRKYSRDSFFHLVSSASIIKYLPKSHIIKR